MNNVDACAGSLSRDLSDKAIEENKKSFRNTYEQKCFIVGMTHILTVQDAPEPVRDPD